MIGRLQALLDACVARGITVGVCASISTGDQAVRFAASGHRDCARTRAMTDTTQLRIYSMTKPVVACAVLRLVEAGRLHLDDPVAAYIPSFSEQFVRTPDGLVRAKRPNTLRDLLQMTSGIRPFFRDGSPEVAALREEVRRAEAGGIPLNTQALASRIGRLTLQCQPGEGFVYGMSAEVLAAVMEVVTGETLGEHLSRTIFGPLSMTDTAFFITRPERVADIAEKSLEGFRPAQAERYRPVQVPPAIEWGGDGLYSTLRDYTKFVNALTFQDTLLRHETLKAMITPEPRGLCQDHFGAVPLLRGCGYGLGMRVVIHPQQAETGSQAGEFGWYGHAGSWFMASREKGVSAVLLAQCLPSSHMDMAPALCQLAYRSTP